MKTILILLCVFASTSFAATSLENRADKKYEALLQMGWDYTIETTQLSFGYYLGQDDIVGIKGGVGKDSDERQTSAGVFYKHYEGNSFYVAGGLTYLNTYEEQEWDIFDSNNPDKYTSIGADVRIGNQWHWKNFTLGCDWIGVGKRFVKFTKEDDDDSDTTFTLLNLNIGASF